MALTTAACNPLSDQYLAGGVGSALNSGQLAQETDRQDEYVYLICRQSAGSGTAVAAGKGCSIGSWATFIRAGMNDIDRRCDAYLTWLDTQRRNRPAVLEQISATGTTTNGILGLTGAGTKAMALVAAAFGLAGATYGNWNSRLLLEVDHSTVQGLVYRRQEQFRQDNSIAITNVSDRPTALYLLRGYLRLCMPMTIETDINSTITLVQNNAPQSVVRAAIVRPAGIAGVITDVRKPLPSPEPYVSQDLTDRLTDKERGLLGKRIEALQRALCIKTPTQSFGPKGSQVRKAMSEFFVGAGLGAFGKIEDQTMLDSLSEGADDIIGEHNTCESRGFPNARAVGEAVNPSKKR
ncbi:hypothetical protein ABID16_001660 [Rhizobium aquaticum]|uniref:Lipoprotein n=1 Tax=Rhizobium aquaticum TaxID=1549636 RepID=A0ABV2J011_9HYPH